VKTLFLVIVKIQLQVGLMFMKNLTVFASFMGSGVDLEEIVKAIQTV